MGLKFLHLHLHGLIRSNNLELGRDSDTGGQTQYVLELVKSLANNPEVDQVDLVTRLISDTRVDNIYSQKTEFLDPGAKILRFQLKTYEIKFFYQKLLNFNLNHSINIILTNLETIKYINILRNYLMLE